MGDKQLVEFVDIKFDNGMSENSNLLGEKKVVNNSEITGVISACSMIFSVIILVPSIYAKIIWSSILTSITLLLSLLTLLNWFGLPIKSTIMLVIKKVFLCCTTQKELEPITRMV